MSDQFFNNLFKQLAKGFRSREKKYFLKDLKGQIEEGEEVLQILQKARQGLDPRLQAVTFDRRKNITYDYWKFDLVLVVLDAISGGHGILKPTSQIRVLQWNGTRKKLLQILQYFSNNNPSMKYRRALIMPFPDRPPVGHNIAVRTYRSLSSPSAQTRSVITLTKRNEVKNRPVRVKR